MRKVIVFIVGASGCAPVGPKYEPLQMATPEAYKEQAADAAVLLQPAQPRDQAPRDKWWQVFGDARLDSLESKLRPANPTLAEAEARFRQAQAIVRQHHAQLYPTVGVGDSLDTGSRVVQAGGTIDPGSERHAISVTGDASPDRQRRRRRPRRRRRERPTQPECGAGLRLFSAALG